MDLVWDIDALRAVDCTCVASYASVCLAKFRYSSIIADQICPSGFSVVFILAAACNFSGIHALVVVQEDGRDVDAVWAWHTVFAVVAWNGRVVLHQFGSFLQEVQLFLVECVKR